MKPLLRIATAAVTSLMLAPGGAAAGRVRVCADPNNLPFSNARGEGFENAMAELLAKDWDQPLEYVWWPQRRGFVRNTLSAGICDVVIGVPAGYDAVLTTRPYYRSSYVFVSLRSRRLALTSLDDPQLRRLRIGVQMIGYEFANNPPAHALSARGLVRNVVGYSVLGDYSQPNPPARIVDAVVSGCRFVPSSTSDRESPELHDRRRELMLWTGILAGPLVWLTLLQTNYVQSYVACELRQTWFLHAATAVSLVIVIAAGVIGSACGPSEARSGRARASGGGAPRALRNADENSETRATWMAWAGATMSLWFAIVIVAMEVPILIVPPCAGR